MFKVSCYVMTEIESDVIINVVGIAASREEVTERVKEYFGREYVALVSVGGDRMDYVFTAKDKDGVEIGRIDAKRFTNH